MPSNGAGSVRNASTQGGVLPRGRTPYRRHPNRSSVRTIPEDDPVGRDTWPLYVHNPPPYDSTAVHLDDREHTNQVPVVTRPCTEAVVVGSSSETPSRNHSRPRTPPRDETIIETRRSTTVKTLYPFPSAITVHPALCLGRGTHVRVEALLTAFVPLFTRVPFEVLCLVTTSPSGLFVLKNFNEQI